MQGLVKPSNRVGYQVVYSDTEDAELGDLGRRDGRDQEVLMSKEEQEAIALSLGQGYEPVIWGWVGRPCLGRSIL